MLFVQLFFFQNVADLTEARVNNVVVLETSIPQIQIQ
jgi:hypothetical protein